MCWSSTGRLTGVCGMLPRLESRAKDETMREQCQNVHIGGVLSREYGCRMPHMAVLFRGTMEADTGKAGGTMGEQRGRIRVAGRNNAGGGLRSRAWGWRPARKS